MRTCFFAHQIVYRRIRQKDSNLKLVLGVMLVLAWLINCLPLPFTAGNGVVTRFERTDAIASPSAFSPEAPYGAIYAFAATAAWDAYALDSNASDSGALDTGAWSSGVWDPGGWGAAADHTDARVTGAWDAGAEELDVFQ
jgi:hypothetical protein